MSQPNNVQRAERPRVAVAFPGDPRNPTTWSGTPLGLSRGLEEAGVQVASVNVEPGPAVDFATKNAVAAFYLRRARRPGLAQSLRHARALSRASPELAVVRSWAGRRAMRRAEPLDALVQIGTGYSFDTTTPIVAFDDLTVVQAVELGYPEWQTLSQRAIRARIDRQRRVYDGAVACCMTTRWAAQSAIDDYDIAPEKVFAVGVGRNHRAAPDSRDWSVPRFIWIGTDWYGKNGDALLRAFARLRREQPSAHLDLVGSHPAVTAEGVTAHGSLSLADPDDRVRMAGLLRTATCFALPSRYEAAAIAYVEAGASGLPCIATTVGGARELIGEAGRLVDPTDDDALFAAMLELSDPETAEICGALALARAHLFTWPAVGQRVLRALKLPGVDVSGFADFL